MTARSALMQDEGASYLGPGSSQSKPINSWEERLSLHRLGYIAKDEASLFRSRQRSNFIIQAQRCEHAGKVLGERHPTAKSRSKNDLQDEARWTGHS
jgi:hypothetical protein